MTLNHAASMLSATMVVACSLMFVTTGSLVYGVLILAAPLPIKWVSLSDRRTWSLGEVLRGRRDDHSVSDALDDALRPPLATPTARDDGSYFVPDCPRLDYRLPAPPAPPTSQIPPAGRAASTPPQ